MRIFLFVKYPASIVSACLSFRPSNFSLQKLSLFCSSLKLSNEKQFSFSATMAIWLPWLLICVMAPRLSLVLLVNLFTGLITRTIFSSSINSLAIVSSQCRCSIFPLLRTGMSICTVPISPSTSDNVVSSGLISRPWALRFSWCFCSILGISSSKNLPHLSR